MANEKNRKWDEIDKESFEACCRAQVRESDIAKILKVSTTTLIKWCKYTYGCSFRDAVKTLNYDGISNVKKKLYDMALKGNSAAVFFYLKNYAGLSDNPKGNVSLEIARSTFESIRKAAAKRFENPNEISNNSSNESEKKS